MIGPDALVGALDHGVVWLAGTLVGLWALAAALLDDGGSR